ncbi:MAG: sulfur carrier protein ThiS [Candidatus Omnitrophota bacterium]|nr:sulfur carrier protein ThiS [Candidatus Omnitrophota bacterium]
MVIRINGKEECIEKNINLAQLLAVKNLQPERIVVEHNARVVAHAAWSGITVQEHDTIEIVSFVGGG